MNKGKVLMIGKKLGKKGFDWLTGKNLTPEQKAEMRKNLYGDGSIAGILGMKKEDPSPVINPGNPGKLKRRILPDGTIEEYG